ncbi:thioesterase family protein [Amycolatopsis sp. CA-230715]|uniref:thioesterase family protein n=1 Tax=Amycolatopsis sp. CA-230715 TaxID=2745196 RepID=UPI001C01D7BE|nr:hypothetical protein [Amycolatopsis sp. CA-230715]QWF85781.1 Fluoroacetyl-CoA thioesterase [Amycolatopsis sp. CA-230715]
MSAPALNRLPERASDAARLLGATRTVHYTVAAEDSVQRLAHRSAEFARNPDILASARLIELCEWPCMDAVRDIIAPDECTLGAWQRQDHRAPVLIGARLVITARCVVANHPYSEWEVRVHDGHKSVARATLGFIVVDRAEFERQRMNPKIKVPASSSG